MIDAIMSFLNSPVPYAHATSNDALYALDAIGGGFIAFCAWWFLCFFIRNGFDGGKLAIKALQRHKAPALQVVLLNNWKVHGSNKDTVGPVDLREPCRKEDGCLKQEVK